jgi:putative endonuclease
LRRSRRWGGAAESITRFKQQRIVATAVYFLKTHSEAPCRFDVLLLEALDIDRVEWIKDAFRP